MPPMDVQDETPTTRVARMRTSIVFFSGGEVKTKTVKKIERKGVDENSFYGRGVEGAEGGRRNGG